MSHKASSRILNKHSTTNHRWMIYVINLDRSTDRWNSIRNNLLLWNLPFERISAIAANEMSESDINQYYSPMLNSAHYFSSLKKSEVGCFLSHRLAWKALLESQYEYAIILEDDVIFNRSPLDLINKLILFLKMNPSSMVKLYSKRNPTGKYIHQLEPGHNLIQTPLPPLGTQAQVLDRGAADKLISQTQVFFEPIDVMLQASWIHGVQMYCLSSPLVQEVSQSLGGSTLKSIPQRSIMYKLKREFVRAVYRLKRFITAWYYWLKL